MVYVLFPDYQDASSWRRRARIMVFGCIKDKSGKELQDQLRKQGCGATAGCPPSPVRGAIAELQLSAVYRSEPTAGGVWSRESRRKFPRRIGH